MAKKKELTHEQKIARGYEVIGTVGTVRVYFTPGDLREINLCPEASRAEYRKNKAAYKLDQEKKRQAGSEEANAPMAPEITEYGYLRIKQSGTRQWILLTKEKAEELISASVVKQIKALIPKMPDRAVVEAAEDAE